MPIQFVVWIHVQPIERCTGFPAINIVSHIIIATTLIVASHQIKMATIGNGEFADHFSLFRLEPLRSVRPGICQHHQKLVICIQLAR